jgi:hypothetical protein
MATFPGFSLLENFSGVFTFLFSFALLFGILEVTHPFGKEKKGLNSFLALMLALMISFSSRVTNIISFMAPWFVVTIVVIFFIMLIEMMFGVDVGVFKKIATGESGNYGRTITYWIITIASIILLLGLSQEFGQEVGPYLNNETISENPDQYVETQLGSTTVPTGQTNTDDFQQNLGATLFHPKVLGMIVILLIASFAVRLLSGRIN